jgi:hypothetical protein
LASAEVLPSFSCMLDLLELVCAVNTFVKNPS